MKRLKKQILFILTFMAILLISNKVNAASATITPSSTSVTTGTTVNLVIGVQSTEAWNLKVSSSGGTLGGTLADAESAGTEVTKTVMNATFSATTAGTYTITLSGDITGSDLGKQSVSKTTTITVTTPVASSPTPSPSPAVTPTFSSLNETVYATQDVNVRSSYSTSSSKLGQLKQGESVVRIGVSNIAVGGYYWSKVTFNGQTGYVASNYLTTTKPEQTTPSPAVSPSPSTSPSPDAKSNDATLKSLSITGVELTPAFASNITSYTASVGEEITEVEVLVEVNDEKATYEVTGNKNLQEGENTIIVTVTAEDGTVTNYEIKLAKGEQIVPVGLVVNGIKENGDKVELSLGVATVVSENIIEYTINLNEWLKSVEILNTIDNAEVFEGTGIFDLQVGENKYTITSKATEEGEETKTIEYRITINNPEKKVEEVKEDNGLSFKTKLIIAGIVIVVGIVIISLIVHYKRQNKVEYGSTDYSFLKNDETIQSKEQERQKDKFNDDDMPNDNGGERRKGGKHF